MKKIILILSMSILFFGNALAQPPVTNSIGTVPTNVQSKYTFNPSTNYICVQFVLTEKMDVYTTLSGVAETNMLFRTSPAYSATPAMGVTNWSLDAGTYLYYAANSSTLPPACNLTFNPSGAIYPIEKNYIKKIIPTVAKSTISNNSFEEIIVTQYFDGLGRPIQTVQKAITPGADPSARKDLIVLQEYDLFGREDKAWLPAAIASNNGGYVTPATVKSAAISSNGNDQNPYSIPVYEASPLNRVLKQFGPGADWHNNGKAAETAYKTNSTTDATLNCKFYRADGPNQSPSLSQTTNYATGELYVTEVKDEDGNTSYEFKDKLGQVVLTRQINGDGHDTYYVYNDFGNLCFVLPPRIQEEGIAQAKLDLLAYQYKYNNFGRCIAKKLPGCDWTYYVYDKADRIIYSQDGEQRNKGEWAFSIPDALSRIVLSGICKDTISVSNKVVKAVYASNGSYKRYNIQVDDVNKLFTNTPSILSVNFYDNYDFRGMTEVPSSGTEYIAESGYGTQYTGGYKGLLTGSLMAQYQSDGTIASTYLYSVMYYDNRERLIQTKGNNHLTGGVEKEYIAYNFGGQPTQRKHVHSVTAKNTQTEIYTSTYDHAGRLLKTTHQLIDGPTVKPQVTLAENSYDDLGRLLTNKKGGRAELNTTYAYNVRSWTKSISSPLFNQELFYNESYGNNTKLYNGNISAMSWQVFGDSYKRGYIFAYDNLSRLTSAGYMENGTANNNYKTAYSYDKHGNIKTLQQYGKKDAGNAPTSFGLVDNLTMDHIGNQLTWTGDAGLDISISESADFKDKSTARGTIEYTYNKNGALYSDLNKGITAIQYNSLNLPQQMVINSSTVKAKNYYTYSASGVKLKTEQRYDPTLSVAPVGTSTPANDGLSNYYMNKDYVGNVTYETEKKGAAVTNKTTILVDGGYIENGVYYFYLTDHLGDNRVVADQSGTAIQKNHYYPFGMAFAEGTTAEQGKQPYKYNGKELDQMHGLHLYDYSARYYEPAIGRFTTVDPLAEKYYSWSPYAYVMNNPLMYIDPTGMYSTAEWKKDHGYTDNDFNKVYEASSEPPTDIVSVDGVVVEHINDGKTGAIHLSTRDVDVWGMFGGAVKLGMDVTSVYSDLFHDHFNYKASDGSIKSLYKGPNSLKPRSLLAKDYIRWSKTLKGIGNLSNGTMIIAGTYNIVNGSKNPLDYTDTAAGLATIIESAVLKYTNAPSSKVPVVGEVVAVYGGLRLSMDVGRFLGVRFGGDAWVRWYREYQNEKEQEAMINRWKQYK